MQEQFSQFYIAPSATEYNLDVLDAFDATVNYKMMGVAPGAHLLTKPMGRLWARLRGNLELRKTYMLIGEVRWLSLCCCSSFPASALLRRVD